MDWNRKSYHVPDGSCRMRDMDLRNLIHVI
jgi:hypothetical protein